MNKFKNSGRASHPFLWTLGILVAAGAALAGYLVFSPGPTAFAQGKQVTVNIPAAEVEASEHGAVAELFR